MTTKHFNDLTPAEAERLAMLAEECGEVIQAVGKILRHGYESTHPDGGPTNREALRREIVDLRVIAYMMGLKGDFPPILKDTEFEEAYGRKYRYAHHQEGK